MNKCLFIRLWGCKYVCTGYQRSPWTLLRHELWWFHVKRRSKTGSTFRCWKCHKCHIKKRKNKTDKQIIARQHLLTCKQSTQSKVWLSVRFRLLNPTHVHTISIIKMCCGQCSNGQQCHHVTGESPKRCAARFQGEKCYMGKYWKPIIIRDNIISRFTGNKLARDD